MVFRVKLQLKYNLFPFQFRKPQALFSLQVRTSKRSDHLWIQRVVKKAGEKERHRIVQICQGQPGREREGEVAGERNLVLAKEQRRS